MLFITLTLTSSTSSVYLNDDNGQLKTFDRTTEVTIHPQNPIIVPSHVFFGLIFVRGVLPNVCTKIQKFHNQRPD
jgi:hypothetical protein